MEGCDQKFVRFDLLARHKKRHTASYTPRNRMPSFNAPFGEESCRPAAAAHGSNGVLNRSVFSHHQNSAGPHDAAILLTPDSTTGPTLTPISHVLPGRSTPTSRWPSSMDERPRSQLLQPKTNYYSTEGFMLKSTPTLPGTSSLMHFPPTPYTLDDQMAQNNFAAWLFDPQATYNDLSIATLPFLEGGLESAFNNNIHYDYDSLKSLSPMDPTPAWHMDVLNDIITEHRRQELLQWFQVFLKKQSRYEGLMPNLLQETGGDMLNLNVDMMRDCLKEFWDHVSPRLPIVHQHTFSANRCHIFLLLVMISLGAASLRGRDSSGQLAEYGSFADVIISSVRWEILTSDDAGPPISLWVAQALLLLEFYEKLCSSRRLHERAHIYHPAFLTLLRRGSPLIGRAGSESPPEPEETGADRQAALGTGLDSRTWWIRWAESESMHRVVFAAFMLDVIHAAMFGHTADMSAHEIRLPLPCDDNLWTASSPDVVRQLDANFRMYGVKQVSFLDGLKSALHGKEVKTHSFGRMIIISGLLSVGWHLSHRETHLKWLDLRAPSTDTRHTWRKLLLGAFDSWKDSFDVAMSDAGSDAAGRRGFANGPINSASLLYHLAHLSLHADIVDCQVFAGVRRLLGRRVSARDHANAVKRMGAWAKQSSTRHAVLHAFRLLYSVLVEPYPRRRNSAAPALRDAPPPPPPAIQYSIRNEQDPHRPWIMYYAVLVIWAFVQALGQPPLPPVAQSPARTREYLAGVAMLRDLDEQAAATLHEGLHGLLAVVEGILGEAQTELLAEAKGRLQLCREMLMESRRGAL